MERQISTTEPVIGKDFPKKIIPLINGSKKSIDIIVFDWRFYPKQIGCSVQLFNNSIILASRRGVKVRAISNAYDIIQTLKKLNIEAKKLITPKLVHIKLIIIDNKYVIIGSHNYTQSAFQMNYELSVILENPDCLKSIQNFFNNLWTTH